MARKPGRSREKRFDVAHYRGRRMYIDDDEFHWDALLRISGDFESDAEKLRFAKAICEVLNKHADEIPCSPEETGAGHGD